MLILALLLIVSAVQPDPVPLDAVSLKKSDLPNGFPFQIFDVGFAVIRVVVTNSTSEVMSVDPENVLVKTPGGKLLKRAQSQDITPKLMKYYKGAPKKVGGAYGSSVPMPVPRGQGPTIDPRARGGTVSIDVPVQLRNVLEYYELKAEELAPGQVTEGYLYVKSKKSGSRLSGGTIEWGGVTGGIR